MNHGELFAFMKSGLENVKDRDKVREKERERVREEETTTKINILRVRILVQNSCVIRHELRAIILSKRVEGKHKINENGCNRGSVI